MKTALLYARLGWRVLPIEPGGKRPILKNWTEAASSDPELVAEWIAQHPSANVGIATGDQFFCLDVDPRNGGDTALSALVETHGELPPTVQAATPSGGSHYLFQMPGYEVANSAGRIGKGIDVRGIGGQIVVAPSRTDKGSYRWVNAPWNVAIAPAPEWLLAEMGRVQIPDSKPSIRGTFPPATPEVLQAARRALQAHGPAIEGDGGRIHTFGAAAILTHDFALSEDEAWPLFLEWNSSCQPPWEPEGLRERLRSGAVDGSAPYGCKRKLDAGQTAKKLISDWQSGTSGEPGMFVMIEQLRTLEFDDTAKRETALKEAMSATGLPAKALNLPKAVPKYVEVKEGQIEVGTRLHETADESIEALHESVFQRNGELCQVVAAPDRTFINDLQPAGIQDLMSRAAKYVHKDDGGLVAQAAPASVAGILFARRIHPECIKVLEAITTAPVFLADGSILTERGYNAQARVWLEPSVDVLVPDEPTIDNARASVRTFKDLLGDFQFAEEADFSSWMAGMLSPLVKAATGNAPCPLVCISASSPGAGKSLLADIVARIVTGGAAEIRPYNPRDPSEWGKRLTAFVKAASPVSVFDNCNGPIGDEGLDRLVTSSTWSDRILGASEAPPLPNVTTWFATGNNIEPVGDTVRRVLMVRIEVDTERPQERTGFKRPLLVEYAEANRAELLTAALVILRAYHLAGYPDQSLAPWGSFTRWSILIRGALVWAGLPDPFLTQQRASRDLNEPENDAHDFWIGIVEGSDGTAADIVFRANKEDAQGVLGTRDAITAMHLRRFVGRFVDKPRLGKRIRKARDEKRNQTRYHVEVIF